MLQLLAITLAFYSLYFYNALCCTCLLFVKAAKLISISIVLLPLAGCALGTGALFGALIKGVAYSPEQDSALFNYATMGFAFIETFAFMCIGFAMFLSGF